MSFLIPMCLFGLFPVGATGPNVLWICADDHAAYVTGAYGNRIVRTPNLDRLAKQSMRFDRAYCNAPVCTASRMSFLTGRYPRTIGVTQLTTALPSTEKTIADLLADAGYETAGFGKMHFNSSLKHGFGKLVDVGDYRRWLKTQMPDPLPGGRRVLGQWRPFREPARDWLNADNLPEGVTERQSLGRYLADQASEFIESKRVRPFFAFVSFYEPHSPFHFPIEFAGRHRLDEFDVPKILANDRWQVPAIFELLTDTEKRGIQVAYYTSTEFMDACVGRVLNALERSGQSQKTIVVYTGDHGYMLGQHGRIEKHCGFEPAIRAPLLIRSPWTALRPASTSALVELIDIVPTILETCGLNRPTGLQGIGLVGLLQGQASRHRDRAVVEYSENEEAYLVEGRWKLIYGTGKRIRQDGYKAVNPTPGRYAKLYDLTADPDELHDLADRPSQSARVKAMIGQLADHVATTERLPDWLPATKDPEAILDRGLAPHDVTGAPSSTRR